MIQCEMRICARIDRQMVNIWHQRDRSSISNRPPIFLLLLLLWFNKSVSASVETAAYSHIARRWHWDEFIRQTRIEFCVRVLLTPLSVDSRLLCVHRAHLHLHHPRMDTESVLEIDFLGAHVWTRVLTWTFGLNPIFSWATILRMTFYTRCTDVAHTKHK